jgi:hypothetical protein
MECCELEKVRRDRSKKKKNGNIRVQTPEHGQELHSDLERVDGHGE